MVVFAILLIIGMFLLWLFLSPFFGKIGAFVIKKAKEITSDKTENEEKTEEKL